MTTKSNNDGGSGVDNRHNHGYDTTITLAPSPLRRSHPSPRFPIPPQDQPSSSVARAAILCVQQEQNSSFSPPELLPFSPYFNYFSGYSSSPSFSSLPLTPLWEVQLRSSGERGQHFTFPDDTQQPQPLQTEVEEEENDIEKGEQRSNNVWKELFSPTYTTLCNVDEAIEEKAGYSAPALATNEGQVDDDTSISYLLHPTASPQSTFSFGPVFTALNNYQTKHDTLNIPTSHTSHISIINYLTRNNIEDAINNVWEYHYTLLKEYKSRAGDCDVPCTDKMLGSWVISQRELYARYYFPHDFNSSTTNTTTTNTATTTTTTTATTTTTMNNGYSDRFKRLRQLDFDFTTPMWDIRLQELIQYKATNGHCCPPLSYPKLGIWVVNQRLNINNMPKERIAALDSIGGFIWHHNRNNRSNTKWTSRYMELVEYNKQNGHTNVPPTHKHSPLGSWVNKQREEYKKLQNKAPSQLDKYRIDKLNEINFQWSIQNYDIISWDDRYKALMEYKKIHGHVKIPNKHPYFGNWPSYQKSQYNLFLNGKKSRLNEDKIQKLIHIGFLNAVPAATITKEDDEKV